MCKCRVCTVGNWILEKSGEDVWEVWAHKGMDLEYNTIENHTWWSKVVREFRSNYSQQQLQYIKLKIVD